ncbi:MULTISPECIES: hypothetical protein [Curtobacterium]|uniref:hypothetical protein n=1 Tax=Curtobacterium TaxID=2034 RepID=UPI00217D9FED|nr:MULTISPECIES: hypothetical protein [Curtobacterium]MCS6566050.1 hypothetical protein [Curtobacterium flaccumfaciens pv. flaccumfaciens]UXZ56756.1 hypothetical protein MXD64_12110 [Curtobacterium sp. Arg-1]
MGETTVPAAVPVRLSVFDTVLRPRRSLVRSTALSIAFSAVPLAVALVWVSFPFRTWAVFAGIVVAMAAAVGVVFVRLHTAFIGIDDDGVTIRGVLTAHRRIPRDRVHSLVLATTFGSSVDRTVRELVAFDRIGTHLFRLRADVWGDDGLDRVVDALGVQVVEDARPVSVRTFAKRYPTSRAWYEQRAAFLLVGGLVVLVVGGLLAVEFAGLDAP